MLKELARRVLRVAMDALWVAELLDGASYLRNRFAIDARFIVEVGCRYGEDSLLLAASYPSAQLLAFECNPETLPATRLHVSHFRSIRLMEMALDRTEGEIDFFAASQGSNPGASSMLAVMPGKERDAWLHADDITHIKVIARRLDGVLRDAGWNSVDILWMDVEGAELRVLQGAGDILKSVGLIYTEVSLKDIRRGQASFLETKTLLESYGFREMRPWLRVVKKTLGAGTANVIFVGANGVRSPGRP